jgi:hypothetical protein
MASFRKGWGRQLRDALVRAGILRSSDVRELPTVPAKQAPPKESAEIFSPAARDLDHPGTSTVPVADQGPEKPPTVTAVYLRKIGDFRPHPAFLAGQDANTRLLIRRSGISPDMIEAGQQIQDEADLVLGLDFGTSCIKAVIRDHLASQAFAVPFTNAAESRYLLPSRVWHTEDRYSLDGGIAMERDLKLGLLGCGAESPIDEFNDACAFLAMVIRHCRGWLLDAHAAEYRRKRIHWSINVGLPSRSYEDAALVRLFRRLGWAAANVASYPANVVTRDLCERYRVYARALYQSGDENPTGEGEFGPEDVDVVPEVVAQIFGLVSGANWDWRNRPMMMLVDIGAGTVDTAFFSFTRQSGGEPRFAFYASDVQPNGVMNLHRNRVNWLLEVSGDHRRDPAVQEYLRQIRLPTDLSLIPESVREYLEGYEITTAPGTQDIDAEFYRLQFRSQVVSCPQHARRNGDIPDVQLKRVPCFLAGGGSRIGFYTKIIDDVNALPRNIRLEKFRMTVPRTGLQCPGMRESDMDRLSVAFGLSHHGAGGRPLGQFIRAINIPKRGIAEEKPRWRDNYVDKDMV